MCVFLLVIHGVKTLHSRNVDTFINTNKGEAKMHYWALHIEKYASGKEKLTYHNYFHCTDNTHIHTYIVTIVHNILLNIMFVGGDVLHCSLHIHTYICILENIFKCSLRVILYVWGCSLHQPPLVIYIEFC